MPVEQHLKAPFGVPHSRLLRAWPPAQSWESKQGWNFSFILTISVASQLSTWTVFLFFFFIYSAMVHWEASSLFQEQPDHIQTVKNSHTWKLPSTTTVWHVVIEQRHWSTWGGVKGIAQGQRCGVDEEVVSAAFSLVPPPRFILQMQGLNWQTSSHNWFPNL